MNAKFNFIDHANWRHFEIFVIDSDYTTANAIEIRLSLIRKYFFVDSNLMRLCNTIFYEGKLNVFNVSTEILK